MNAHPLSDSIRWHRRSETNIFTSVSVQGKALPIFGSKGLLSAAVWREADPAVRIALSSSQTKVTSRDLDMGFDHAEPMATECEYLLHFQPFLLHFRLVSETILPHVSKLLAIADRLSAPPDYFSGRRRNWSCQLDNILFFLRKNKTALQQETFESRQHHRFVLLFNLETRGMVSVDRRFFRLAPGQGMLILPFQFHHYINLAQESLRWLFITFESKTPEALENFRFQVFSMDANATARVHHLLELALAKAQPDRNNLLLSEFHSLLCQFHMCLKPGKKANRPSLVIPSENDPLAIKILTLTNSCLRQSDRSHHSIKYLARRCSLSESRLRFWFSHFFGLSLGAYIRNFKIHQTIACMQKSGVALYEVADACGYSSLATFSRSFKAQTGITPSEFRQKHLTKTGPS